MTGRDSHESTKTMLGHESTKARKNPIHGFRVFVFSWLFIVGVSCFRVFVACLVVLAGASPASAAEHYALVVTGASGGPQYAQKYDNWRTSFVTTLVSTFGYPADRVIVLGEDAEAGVRKSTRENVRAALASLQRRATKNDVVLIMLMGHGTVLDDDGAKFNLVGPDLTADEWVDLVKPIAGRLIFINTTSGSFPFLRKLSGPGRIVLTATDAAAQQFETVFPEFFTKAFDEPGADLDKNKRVSIWEAFTYASARVHDWFDVLGQLATERPLLDDTGDGVGGEADNAGRDGAIAQLTYLAPEVVIPTGNPELAGLVKRRAELEAAVDELRLSKPTLTPEQYELQLEKLLLELAQIERQIRAKS